MSQYALELVLALADFIGEHADEVGDGAVDLITSLADTLATENNLQKVIDVALKIVSNFAEGLVSGDNMDKLAETARAMIDTIATTLLGTTENGGSNLNDIVSTGTYVGGELLSGFAQALFGDNGVYAILDDLNKKVGEYLADNFWKLGTMAIEGFISGIYGEDFSFEDWGAYLFDEMEDGTLWEDYFAEANDMWLDIFNNGLGLKYLSKSYRNGYTDANGNAINGWELTDDGWVQNVNFDEISSKMDETVASNTEVSTEIGNYSSSITNSVDGLSNKIDGLLNKKTDISLYLYPNSELMAQAQVEGLGIANATSGGHNNGY